MKVWANCIVHNEENFIWFAIMSVVDFVDKVLIWDTGSTDKTVEIIKEIIKTKGEKIEFKEVGEVDKYEFTKLRQEMLNESKCDWILVLDGDEIWWENSVKALIKKINTDGNDIEGIVVPVTVPVGDIYHFQEESAGRYEILGRKGHLNLRAINRKIPGLHVMGVYPLEGYFDDNNRLIQENKGIIFMEQPYLHATHLPRSAKIRTNDKVKLEIGQRPPANFKYPETLTKPYPDVVPNPWNKLTGLSLVLAKAITPFKKIKRSLL